MCYDITDLHIMSFCYVLCEYLVTRLVTGTRETEYGLACTH